MSDFNYTNETDTRIEPESDNYVEGEPIKENDGQPVSADSNFIKRTDFREEDFSDKHPLEDVSRTIFGSPTEGLPKTFVATEHT